MVLLRIINLMFLALTVVCCAGAMAGLIVFFPIAAGGFMLTLLAVVGDDGDAEKGRARSTSRAPSPRRAVILGGGFAGASVARALGRLGVEVTIVSPENFMLYTPLLPEAASGTLEPRHVVVPLRELAPDAQLILGRATALRPSDRSVEVETEVGRIEVPYDDVVVALGSVPRPLDAAPAHAFAFRSLADAVALRNHVIRRLELAAIAPSAETRRRELTFVFVGGGYAGVEALAETHDLVRRAIKRHPSLRTTSPRFVLVDAGPSILREVPSKLAGYAKRQLARRGVEILSGTFVDEAHRDGVVLSNGSHIETSTFVWTAGSIANPAVRDLELPLDEAGRVIVDETLRVPSLDHVWALGDVARVPNPSSPSGFDPPTCQHALRQARRLAVNLAGQRHEPYRYRMLGQVATLGHRKGIADVLGVRLYGFAGWAVTRAYHLYQLPTANRRLRVAADWAVAAATRRDLADLSAIGHAQLLPISK